jgi:protein transport protein SEC24
MILPDLDHKPEDFLPLPDGLLVNLSECRAMVEFFLKELPKLYQDNHDTDSALGSALQIAQKLLSTTGGRVTVVQTRIPNINPGALHDQVTSSTSKAPTSIGPTSDYYKKLSLDYASFQIACDLFLLNSHHIDLATLSRNERTNEQYQLHASPIDLFVVRLYIEIFRRRS